MAKKQQFSVRLPPDTAAAVEAYAEENDLSNADALRRACEDFYLDEGEAVSTDRIAELETELRRQDQHRFARELTLIAGIAFVGVLVLVDLPQEVAIAAVAALMLGAFVHVGYWAPQTGSTKREAEDQSGSDPRPE